MQKPLVSSCKRPRESPPPPLLPQPPPQPCFHFSWCNAACTELEGKGPHLSGGAPSLVQGPGAKSLVQGSYRSARALVRGLREIPLHVCVVPCARLWCKGPSASATTSNLVQLPLVQSPPPLCKAPLCKAPPRAKPPLVHPPPCKALLMHPPLVQNPPCANPPRAPPRAKLLVQSLPCAKPPSCNRPCPPSCKAPRGANLLL